MIKVMNLNLSSKVVSELTEEEFVAKYTNHVTFRKYIDGGSKIKKLKEVYRLACKKQGVKPRKTIELEQPKEEAKGKVKKRGKRSKKED